MCVCTYAKVYDAIITNRGPALIAEWSEALPLIASCLLPLPRFESRPGRVRKLPLTWIKVVPFPNTPASSSTYIIG